MVPNVQAYLRLDRPSGGQSNTAEAFISNSFELNPINVNNKLHITECESLFRRRPGGFSKLSKLLPKALEITAKKPNLFIQLEFNAFSYAFLKGAKNFDLQLSEDLSNPFREQEPQFRRTLSQLSQFEQNGQTFPPISSKQLYLALRQILCRPSAREERWTIAELLISGPSSYTELALEFESWDTLIERSVRPLIELGVISVKHETLELTQEHLVLCYFLVKETLGINPLALLTL